MPKFIPKGLHFHCWHYSKQEERFVSERHGPYYKGLEREYIYIYECCHCGNLDDRPGGEVLQPV